MTKLAPSNIVLINPAEYFHAALSGALDELRVRASEHAKQYLVSLLSKFIFMENLYPEDPAGEGKRIETLTEKLALAMEEESTEARLQRFREMGDYSLYIAGFFSESLSRKLVDVDYYIGMGGAAYEKVARLQSKVDHSELFEELAVKFPLFVDVLGVVSDESSAKLSDQSTALLRAYEVWNKTGSERLARQLVQAGMLPAQKNKKTGNDSKQ